MIEDIKGRVEDIFRDEAFKDRYYHSWDHTQDVVKVTAELADTLNLSKNDKEDLILAAYLHDIGFMKQSKDHEQASAEMAGEILSKEGLSNDRIGRIKRLIRVTEVREQPTNILEQVIKDADMSHIGSKKYFEKVGLLRQEWKTCDGKVFEDSNWGRLTLEFLLEHKFYTEVAKEKFNSRKFKNLQKSKKKYQDFIRLKEQKDQRKSQLNAGKDPYEDMELKKPSRGIETMYRVALRNHNQLSNIADNKANILLSINAIMLSIIISALIPKLDTNPALVFPTVILVVACLVTFIFATISTRPKVTTDEFDEKKFLDGKFNVLFFGNFYKMPVDKFEWAMEELQANSHLLYSSLSKDLYYLGLVLFKKYKFLRIAYTVFMVGMIISAISFMLVFVQF